MRNRSEWTNLLKVGVGVFSSLLFLASIYLSFQIKFMGEVPDRNLSALTSSSLWLLIGFFVINILFETYTFYNKTLTELFYITALSQVVLTVYLMALSFAGNWLTFPRSVILINLFVGTLIMFLSNTVVYKAYQHFQGQKKVMVVGKPERALEAVHNFDLMPNRRHKVTHAVLNDYVNNVKRLADEVDIVYLAGELNENDKIAIYDYLMKHNKKLFLSTNFENLVMVNPNIMNFQDESIIEISPFKIPASEALLKRLFDIVVSAIALIVLAPVFIATAIAIKVDSPGPIFYRQERVTLHQKSFNMLKFRSMSATAEKDSGPVLATSNDARVTKVGKFLRQSRIDEIPQFINVLKGDMSIVGPRPERPFFVNRFVEQNPYYSLRHHVRAGITGYAQVYGKYSTDFNSKLNFDLLYIKNYSLGFDAKLLFQTVGILFDKLSSKGLDEELLEPSWRFYRNKIKVIE